MNPPGSGDNNFVIKGIKDGGTFAFSKSERPANVATASSHSVRL